MRIAEAVKFVNRATEVKRALRLQRGHQHGFFRAKDFGGFAHETHAGHQQRLRRMLAAKARHLKGIRHAAAGLFGQRLDFRIGVVMRHHHRIACFEQAFNFFDVTGFFLRAEARRFRREGINGAFSIKHCTHDTALVLSI